MCFDGLHFATLREVFKGGSLFHASKLCSSLLKIYTTRLKAVENKMRSV